MKAVCPRLFEVEAMRDGRLEGAELVRFQTHLASCAACAGEARALEAVAEALRSTTGVADADELHIRRERTRLLAAFDARLVPAPRGLARLSQQRGWLRSAASVALLSALAALYFVLWPARPAPPPPPEAPLASAPEPVTIHADSSARWSRQVEARLDKIFLESGALSIHVDHATSARRLLVLLPDGELEDIGTTFSVSAAAGRTTRVTVQEGSVVLRLHGEPSLTLGAGASWSPPPSSAATPPPATPPPATPPPAAAARRSIQATPSVPPAPRRSTPDTDPSAEFRAAMSAFNGGDDTLAAARFAAFLRQHPLDLRAEDAAYLRVLALQRSGDSPAAQQAAHDYLRSYPRGFRRAEVEALLRQVRETPRP
ncbi:MAG: hypothetical protein RL033_7741 [Pseudomonadota bacterium]